MIEAIEEGQGAKSPATYSVISFPAKDLPQQYEALVFARWLRSFRFGNSFIKKTDPTEYYKQYHKYIEMLLKKPESVVRLAALSDDHDVVLGFSVTRGLILDYVHVQVDHRRTGIAKKLVPKDVAVTTHMTQLAQGIWQAKYKYLTFNPFI
jgi:hypothetical protein